MLREQDPSRPQGNRNAGGIWAKSAMRNLVCLVWITAHEVLSFCVWYPFSFNARVVAQSPHDAFQVGVLERVLLLDSSLDMTSVLSTLSLFATSINLMTFVVSFGERTGGAEDQDDGDPHLLCQYVDSSLVTSHH